MNIDKNLLVVKSITPIQKLILGSMLNEPPIVFQIAGGSDKTCGEIGKELGVSRAKIKVEVELLVEQGMITSETFGWNRRTNVTDAFLSLLKGGNIKPNKA